MNFRNTNFPFELENTGNDISKNCHNCFFYFYFIHRKNDSKFRFRLQANCRNFNLDIKLNNNFIKLFGH